jgi:predicted hydrocarbon binding protein
MPAILRIKQPKETLNEDQKTFRRLKNQLETLKEKERKRQAELDQGLLFYHEKIRIEEEKIDRALEERVHHAYQLYKTTKSFSRRELNTLKDFILSDIDSLLKSAGIHGLSKKMEEIGKALGWKGAEATLIDELNPMIEDIETMFARQGIKVDLSHIDIKDSEEEMARKLFEQVKIGMDQREDLSEKNHPKKSKKLQKTEELQKKSINALYKQLAKALHPDLESDLEKKAKKEEQMKKLTVAYENGDLPTLLELEREWIDSSERHSAIGSSDQLKIYNEILRQQIGIIKDRIEMLFLHPRYLPVQQFYEDRFTGMTPLLKAYQGTRTDLENIESFIDQLKSPQAEKVLKRILQQERVLQEIESSPFSQRFSAIISP